MLESYDNFRGHKVLAIYRCGSAIYGLSDSESDKDFTIILDDYNSRDVIKEGDADYFVFGKETYLELLSLKLKSCYSKIWLDNITLLKDNLVYLDPGYKEEFERITNVDWSVLFKEWLKFNVWYFKARLNPNFLDKSLYHVYRIHSIVDLYEREGKFLSRFNDEDFKNALDYKSNESNRKNHYLKIKTILQELEDKL